MIVSDRRCECEEVAFSLKDSVEEQVEIQVGVVAFYSFDASGDVGGRT